jgi:HK97 family phage portal protein
MGFGRFIKNVGDLARVELRRTEERSTNVFTLLNNNLGKFLSGLFGNDDDCAVNDRQSMRNTTVYICVQVRAEALSTFPASVKQYSESGSRTATEHPAHKLIHDKPNPFQTACDFWKTVSAHIDVYGNCFAVITYSGSYRPKRLDLIQYPNEVQILVDEQGDAWYQYGSKKYASYEILHFKDLSLDGFYGCGKIKYNAETISYSNKLKKYGKNAVGVKPPGYFSTDANFATVDKQGAALAKTWNDNIAEGKTPILPFGLKYMNLMISPGEAQYLEAIGATKEDIYGIFRVPPSLAQSYGRVTWANGEQQDLNFVKHTMLPLVTNIEQECNCKLFAEENETSKTPYYVKFNTGALLRGDFKSRTEGYRTLFQIGAINGDTIAELEDWNKWEGGDRRFIPMNMIPLDKIDEFIAQLTEPVDSPAGDPGGSQQQRGMFSLDQLKKFLISPQHTNGHEK